MTEAKDEYRFHTANNGPGDQTALARSNRPATALPLLSTQGSVGIAVLP
ncbi:MAG: hypothetical protein VYE77_11230 [Planctomycetota bacterium]|nr:hypothetical protein [Planctomycetota bacterium]